jgi:hypothetical protein
MDKDEADIKMEVKIVLSKWSNKLAQFRKVGCCCLKKEEIGLISRPHFSLPYFRGWTYSVEVSESRESFGGFRQHVSVTSRGVTAKNS